MDGASGRGADAQVVAVATAVGATKRRPPHALEVDVGGVGTTSALTARCPTCGGGTEHRRRRVKMWTKYCKVF